MTEIYLSGACANVSIEERNLWRQDIELDLSGCKNIKIFNPNKYFSYDRTPDAPSRLVMDYFLSVVKRCELIVVNLNNSAMSCGTAFEVQKAVDEGKLIIGFGNENVYDYTRDCCSVVFNNLDEVIEFIYANYV